MNMYMVYETSKGDIRIVYDENGVSRVYLPYDNDFSETGLEYREDEDIKKFFDLFFSGKEGVKPKLNAVFTPFQKKVFDVLINTRMGTVLTYGDIAQLIGCASPRAVGQALRCNPVPIIVPCHRVVGKGWDGGFAGETSGTKVDYKKYLLQIEKEK